MRAMIGQRLANYEITGHLGSGGMGDVYEARDLKLGRQVALKLLPEAFLLDVDRVARFEREARILASLNHPNIAGIHGLDDSDGRKFLVMELVPGETLAQRITRGALPIRETLVIAAGIAQALEAAHQNGIIHRDLKPANIKLTPEGKVKVLDFGLAKSIEPETHNPALSNSPTVMSGGSIPGMILGTASYMSPEQAKGRPVDKRSDIFAFGCVLYEMLTGHRAFNGEDVSDILGAVLKVDPDWSRLPPDLPRDIQRLLRLCLEKNANNRRSNATDVRLDLKLALDEQEIAGGRPTVVSPRNGKAWKYVAAGLVTLVIAAFALMNSLNPPRAPREMRLEVTTPLTSAALEFALSPDGRYIAFVASGDGPQRLWLRSLDEIDARVIAGTEGAGNPFWSADSRSIGFFVPYKLMRIDISGGSPQVLAAVGSGRGGTWNSDGTIVFAPSVDTPLLRIAATGGTAVAVTTLHPPQQESHRSPQFLPDGKHFVFSVRGSDAGVYMGSLDGENPKRLVDASSGAYLTPDMIAFIRGNVLSAQSLNVERGELTGNPVPIADSVGAFSVAADGTLAYRLGTAGLSQLVWYDRKRQTSGNRWRA